MRFVKPTKEMAIDIGLGLRAEDELEVRLSHNVDPITAVLESFINSDICDALEGDDGTPVGMCGVARQQVWLLGTDDLTINKSHKKFLCIKGVCLFTMSHRVLIVIICQRVISLKQSKLIDY